MLNARMILIATALALTFAGGRALYDAWRAEPDMQAEEARYYEWVTR